MKHPASPPKGVPPPINSTEQYLLDLHMDNVKRFYTLYAWMGILTALVVGKMAAPIFGIVFP